MTGEAFDGAGPRDDPSAVPEPAATMNIGTFARRSRLSPKALRLYARRGVLTPAQVDPHSGYRRYTESQLATARLVAMLRRLEMPLTDVRELVNAPVESQTELLERYWSRAEARFAVQREQVDHLRARMTGVDPVGFPIAVRHVAAQRVLTVLRHTTVAGLSDWIGTTLHRLHGTAQAHGLVTGQSWVIYHGEVNEDSDGPVEICVPIPAAGRVPGTTRIEPEHHEAYTSITVARAAFPQILSAYDAVEQWVRASGRTVSGSPREVYVAGYAELGLHEQGCDVAFPIDDPLSG
ncbi:MAG: MerR family transcriptional regulator [Propionibacteriaceae bacterium]